MNVQIAERFLNLKPETVAFIVHTGVLNVLRFRRQENVTVSTQALPKPVFPYLPKCFIARCCGYPEF